MTQIRKEWRWTAYQWHQGNDYWIYSWITSVVVECISLPNLSKLPEIYNSSVLFKKYLVSQKPSNLFVLIFYYNWCLPIFWSYWTFSIAIRLVDIDDAEPSNCVYFFWPITSGINLISKILVSHLLHMLLHWLVYMNTEHTENIRTDITNK